MLFNSQVFLVILLPILLLLYYTLGNIGIKTKNAILLVASLIFYAWGEPIGVFLLIGSIVFNWLICLFIDKKRETRYAKIFLIVSIVVNIGVLFVFKYLVFGLSVFDSIFNTNMNIPNIVLPIGISFYTFQAISYVVDVYRNDGVVQKNLLNVALYISFFPQLIAGPIVRYQTFSDQIDNRKESFELFGQGIIRFCIGLAKKVILANNLAVVADTIFASNSNSVLGAWIGIISYTLQIYFDFSGYSDMAIGLAKMFGFNFLENFNYPYIAHSVTDFWRRWHMSLSTWFRDYVYIPLGGSRCDSKLRVISNLFIVWCLTGIWHGANWTFLIWGLWYFVFLVFEKYTSIGKKISDIPVLSNIYTLLVIVVGWVFFRSDTLPDAISYIGSLVGIGVVGGSDVIAIDLLKEYSIVLTMAIFACLPWNKIIHIENINNAKLKATFDIMINLYCLGLFVVCFSFITSGSYNPFIYFNF